MVGMSTKCMTLWVGWVLGLSVESARARIIYCCSVLLPEAISRRKNHQFSQFLCRLSVQDGDSLKRANAKVNSSLLPILPSFVCQISYILITGCCLSELLTIILLYQPEKQFHRVFQKSRKPACCSLMVTDMQLERGLRVVTFKGSV